jgi:hypothetical protein
MIPIFMLSPASPEDAPRVNVLGAGAGLPAAVLVADAVFFDRPLP